MRKGWGGKGRGYWGKWWWGRVVTKGSGQEGGEEGKRWQWEIGDGGKWWQREKGEEASGDNENFEEGNSWRREAITMGCGDEESGDDGSGEEGTNLLLCCKGLPYHHQITEFIPPPNYLISYLTTTSWYWIPADCSAMRPAGNLRQHVICMVQMFQILVQWWIHKLWHGRLAASTVS